MPSDPTYLRTIHDCLLSGIIHKDNASALPMGLVGMYEEALPPASNVNERKKFLEFFAVWALLKKEVSVAFLMPLLEGWSEETIIYYINKYSKWFNSPQSGKYVLYHERLRAFILQKISKQQFNAYNETIIKVAHDALSRRSGDEWENYALEYLSNHMLIPAIEKGDGTVLKLLAYNTTHWKRQVEISKGFEWSKRMLNNMMIWASKYDDEEVIECALNKVDLHHQEQNDAPRIVELVAQNDIENALDRIDKFGGQDKEGLQRKFILYMLCLMELTLLESKDKPFRREAIEKLLKHFDNNFSKTEISFDWAGFFPIKTIISIIGEFIFLDLSYESLAQTSNFSFHIKIDQFSNVTIVQGANIVAFNRILNRNEIFIAIDFYFKNKLYSNQCYDKYSTILIQTIFNNSGQLDKGVLIDFLNDLKNYLIDENSFYNYLGRLVKNIFIVPDFELILVDWMNNYFIQSFSLLSTDLKAQVLDYLLVSKQIEPAKELMLKILDDPKFHFSTNIVLLKFGIENKLESFMCEFKIENYFQNLDNNTLDIYDFIDFIEDSISFFSNDFKIKIINKIENKIENWDSAISENEENKLDLEFSEKNQSINVDEWEEISDNYEPEYEKYSLMSYLLSKDKIIKHLNNRTELFNWFYKYYNDIDNIKKKADESFSYVSVLCLFVEYTDIKNELYKINETLIELERDPTGYVLDDYYTEIIQTIACHGYFNEFNSYYSDWFKRNYISNTQLPVSVIEFIVESLINKRNSDLLILYIKHIGYQLSNNPALSYRIAKEIHYRCGQKLIINDEQWSEFIKDEVLYKLFYLERLNSNEAKKIEYTNFLVNRFKSEFSLSSFKIAKFDGPDEYDYPGPYDFIGVMSLEKSRYCQTRYSDAFLILNIISSLDNLKLVNDLYYNLIQLKNDKFIREHEKGGISSLALFESECGLILRNLLDKKQNNSVVNFALYLLKSRSVFKYVGEWAEFILKYYILQNDYSQSVQFILNIVSRCTKESKITRDKLRYIREVIKITKLLIQVQKIDLGNKINKHIETELLLFNNNELIISGTVYEYWELRINLGLGIDESWLIEETITYLNETNDLEYKQELFADITRIGSYKVVFEIFEKLKDKESYASTSHYLNVLKYVQKNFDEQILYIYIKYCEPLFDDLDEILFGVFNNNKFTEAINICTEIIKIFEDKNNRLRKDIRKLLEGLKIVFSNRELILSIRPTAFDEVSELKAKGGMFVLKSRYTLSEFIETLFENTELIKNQDKLNKLLNIFERSEYYVSCIEPTCLIYLEIWKYDAIWHILNEIEDKSIRDNIIKRIISKLLAKGSIKEAHALYDSINNKEDFQAELQSIYLENIKTKELKLEIKYDGPINQERKIIEIFMEMIKQDRILNAEKILLKINQEKVRYSVLKNIGRKLLETNGYEGSVAIVNKFANNESKTLIKYFIRLALNATNINKLIAVHSLKDSFQEIDCIEHLLKAFALHELFLVDVPEKNIKRYKQTLSIQWAIDIKNSISASKS